MEKQNVAKPGVTPCSYCGRKSTMLIDGKAACSLHDKLLKQAAEEDQPLKDAGHSLEKDWNK